MSRRVRTSAGVAVGVLVGVVMRGGCGRPSRSSSKSPSTPAVCPASPAGSPTTNGPDSPSGSPNAPKLTAMEIAQRLPPIGPSPTAQNFNLLSVSAVHRKQEVTCGFRTCRDRATPIGAVAGGRVCDRGRRRAGRKSGGLRGGRPTFGDTNLRSGVSACGHARSSAPEHETPSPRRRRRWWWWSGAAR
jgi:hypothetical protein